VAVATKDDPTAKVPLQGLDTNYCDNFQCTSSPAIEGSVRAFARDIVRLRTTASLFNKDIKYSDGCGRSFTGIDKYARTRWYSDNITKPVVVVTQMQMLDKGTAQIDWRITGTLGAMPVDIGVQSRITMNLLTGRIEEHRESWDLSRCSPPAAAMATANRVAWAAKQASADTTESINRSLESLGSFDEDAGPGYTPNPSDPTRFFQPQQDNQFNDAVMFTALCALLYAIFKAYEQLAQL